MEESEVIEYEKNKFKNECNAVLEMLHKIKNKEIPDRKIRIICPICKSEKELSIQDSEVKKEGRLITISIPRGLVCEHHFQAFIDKDLKVRGYQKVDLDLTHSLKNLNNNENESIQYKDSWRPRKTLKEIYDEFWEFIDETNPQFQEFILKDERRKNIQNFL